MTQFDDDPGAAYDVLLLAWRLAHQMEEEFGRYVCDDSLRRAADVWTFARTGFLVSGEGVLMSGQLQAVFGDYFPDLLGPAVQGLLAMRGLGEVQSVEELTARMRRAAIRAHRSMPPMPFDPWALAGVHDLPDGVVDLTARRRLET